MLTPSAWFYFISILYGLLSSGLHNPTLPLRHYELRFTGVWIYNPMQLAGLGVKFKTTEYHTRRYISWKLEVVGSCSDVIHQIELRCLGIFTTSKSKLQLIWLKGSVTSLKWETPLFRHTQPPSLSVANNLASDKVCLKINFFLLQTWLQSKYLSTWTQVRIINVKRVFIAWYMETFQVPVLQ